MSVKLPLILSRGVVLQRGAEVKLWGKANEPVTVRFLGRQYEASMKADGSWEAVLSGLEPGGPFTLGINEITIEDVYVGDVWLCSGQSNIQMTMQRPKHMYPWDMEDPNRNIHMFTVPQKTDFNGPQDDVGGGEWLASSPETIAGFSALGYFFAKRLNKRYGIPIGLIGCAIGGAPIHCWMSRGALADFPELFRDTDKFRDSEYVKREEEKGFEGMKSFADGIDKDDPGLAEQWYSPGYDDSAWEERDIHEPWKGTGSVWLRKTLEIPEELAGKPAELFLGTVNDSDTVYVNGEIVGNTTYRYPPRDYTIPSLPKGRCVITARIISIFGGGFTRDKQYWLSTEEGSFDLSGAWRFHQGGKGVLTGGPGGMPFHLLPSALYNGMLAPLTRFTIKGALWYQGESDAGNAGRYAEKFANLVRGWRKDWGYEFPFLFVELPHWDGGADWHIMRKQQRLSLSLPKTAMAAAVDLGEHNDLHPLNKRDIGERLARCAMRVAYGEKLPPSPFEIVGYK